MTSSDTKPPRTPLHRAAWLGLVTVILVLLAAGYADRQLKMPPHPGFLPQDMPLYLYTPDLPLSWQHLSNTPLAGNLGKEAAPVLHDIELSLRKLTGIRPTPARWRTWLGGSMAAADDGKDWILCAHPGLAARAASLVFRGNAFRGTQIHQVWREGYLLLSSSAILIEKALAAPPVAMDMSRATAPDTLVIEINKPIRTVLSVTPSAELPIQATFFQPKTPVPRTPPMWTAPVLSGTPTILLSLPDVQSATQLATLLAAMNLPDPTAGLLGTLANRWSLNRLPSFLSASGPMNAPMSFALYGFSAASGVPLPQLAVASAAKEGFAGMLSTPRSPNKLFPYEWSGCPGWMFPLLDDRFSLYGFKRDATHYLATQEPLAAMLAAAPQTSQPDIEDDVVITLDWKRFASALMETADWAAAHELLEETNPKDLDAVFMPVLRALSQCGTLHLTGRWTSEGLLCEGVLTGATTTERTQ